MLPPPLIALPLLFAMSLVAAAVIVFVLLRITVTPSAAQRPRAVEGEGASFLFEGDELVDATPSGRRMLLAFGTRGTSPEALAAFLARRFPELPRALARLGTEGEVVLSSDAGREWACLRRWDGLTRIELMGGGADFGMADSLRAEAMSEELATLRSILEDAPQLVWQENTDGAIVWANRAYLDLADVLAGADRGEGTQAMPPLAVFAVTEGEETQKRAGAQQRRRVAIDLPGAPQRQWYEVTTLHRADGKVHYAVDANRVVEAEKARQTFVQTLTKTFAHLSIGLAIFDRERRLTLFNPALMDLTGLPASFLSARPLVHSFLDRLRDRNMLPEPKHYVTWREQVTALEAAAAQGTYCETWTLPTGQTFRVTGRPQPEGAVAFLFEDISDELSLTRHYRSELETAQSVLDTMEDAVAVFSLTGTLVLGNTTYDALWGVSRAALSDVSLFDEIDMWQARSPDSGAIWQRLREFLSLSGQRQPWSETLRLDDGRALRFRVTALPGGSTLVGFAPLEAVRPRALGPSGPEPEPMTQVEAGPEPLLVKAS